MIEWYTKDLWKAYISWFSPRWAMPRDEYDPKEWVDKLERGGFRVAVMHTKHHDGVCFFPSKYREAQPERDFVGEFTAEAHKRGMRVVAYYSTTPDIWSCEEHPEWSCVEKDGTLTKFDWNPCESPQPVGICCINNPGYRALLLGQLEEIQHNYNTDGFWMDIFWYSSYARPQYCFCYHCRSKYAKYSGGKKLEEMWETQEVQSWYRDSFLELLKDIRKIASADGIERVITYNYSGTGYLPGYEEIDKVCNTFSSESHSVTRKSVISRLLAPKKKPFELYSPVSDTICAWKVRPTNRLILEAAIVAAHGGSLLGGFDVKQDGYISGYEMDQLGKVADYMRKREEYMTNTTPLYDVGLLMPKDRGSVDEEGWAKTLLRCQIPFAMLLPQVTDMPSYPLIILEDGFLVNEMMMKKLEEYVADGGNLIVEHNAAGINKDNGDNFLLSKLLGVTCRGRTGFDTNYLGKFDKGIAQNLIPEPIHGMLADEKAWKLDLTTAEALAYYVYPIARWCRDRYLWGKPNPPRKEISKDPAITLNRFGKGKVIYIGRTLGKDAARTNRHELIQLSRNLVSFFLEEPLLRSETPSGVEIIINSQPGRHLIHLLNHYVDMTYLYDKQDNVPSLANVSVWINEKRIGRVKKIIRVPDNEEIKVERDGFWVHLVAPQLDIHEIFTLVH